MILYSSRTFAVLSICFDYQILTNSLLFSFEKIIRLWNNHFISAAEKIIPLSPINASTTQTASKINAMMRAIRFLFIFLLLCFLSNVPFAPMYRIKQDKQKKRAITRTTRHIARTALQNSCFYRKIKIFSEEVIG